MSSKKGKTKIPRGIRDENIPKKKSKPISKGKGDYFASTAMMRQHSIHESDEDEDSTVDSGVSTRASTKTSSALSNKSSTKASVRSSSKQVKENLHEELDDENEDNEEEGIHKDDLSSEEEDRSKKKKSSPMQFFKKSTNETDKYICLKCEEKGKKKSLKMINGIDSGLRKHLGSVHDMERYLYKSQQNQKKQQESPDPPEDDTTAENTTCRLVFTREIKKELDDAVLNCIIEDGRSFNDFRKPGMKKFLKLAIPGYKAPHRVTIARRVRTSYRTHRNKLKKVLQHIDHISLTVDL